LNPTGHGTVLVTGAGGFIGRDVVKHLLRRGWRVRAMVHRSGSGQFPADEKLEVAQGDMCDAASLHAAVKSADAVVHLAAAKSDEPDSADINVGGARRLVEACRSAGCSRVINISTMAVKIPRQGTYARTKAEANEVFANSTLGVTTLLPSVVYGEAQEGVFGSVLKFVRKLPVVPVLGDGQWISAPLYIGDLSEAISACLEKTVTVGKRYELGGPDQISFDELIGRLCAELGIRRPKLHIPFGLALAAARVGTRLLPRCPITVSNVLGSNQTVPIDIEPARRDFGFNPLDFKTGLKIALGKIVNPRANANGSGS
jgi:nucleoside-diphosphate-sugar epimerase